MSKNRTDAHSEALTGRCVQDDADNDEPIDADDLGDDLLVCTENSRRNDAVAAAFLALATIPYLYLIQVT